MNTAGVPPLLATVVLVVLAAAAALLALLAEAVIGDSDSVRGRVEGIPIVNAISHGKRRENPLLRQSLARMLAN